MNEILDCPFCGGCSQEVVSNDVSVVCCMSCFATASPEQWNTRHTPEGWQLVPVEADLDMRKAARPYPQAGLGLWHAMLAASPKWGGE